MYGKAHQSMYTGSMLGAGPDVFSVWGWIIAHVVNGVVEVNASLLSVVIGKITPEEVCEVLLFLCRPDPKSRSQEEDGRRLTALEDVPIEPGRAIHFKVVNHNKYRDFKTPETRREYMREYMKNKRAGGRVNPVSETGVNIRHADADADTLHTQKNGDDLDDRIRTFMAGHAMMNYSAVGHSNIRKMVEEGGWQEMVRCIDVAVAEGAGEPTSYAKKVLSSQGAKKRLKKTEVEKEGKPLTKTKVYNI